VRSLQVLAETQSEAVGSMGDDTPMPVLSTRFARSSTASASSSPRSRTRRIDSLRERIVMSLETGLGRKGNLFEIGPDHGRAGGH
jgi:glutamate synthase (NADPH/NADH) large chain